MAIVRDVSKVLARDPSTHLLDGQFQFWTGEKFLSCLCGRAFLQVFFSLATPNTANIFTYFIKIVLGTVKFNKNLYIVSKICVFL